MKLESRDVVHITFETLSSNWMSSSKKLETYKFEVENIREKDKKFNVELILLGRNLSPQEREIYGAEKDEMRNLGGVLNIQLDGDYELLKTDGELGEIIPFVSNIGRNEEIEDLEFEGETLEDLNEEIKEGVEDDIINPPSQLEIVEKQNKFNLRYQDKIIIKKDGEELSLNYQFELNLEDSIGTNITFANGEFRIKCIFSGNRNKQGYYECYINEINNPPENINFQVGDLFYLKKSNRLVRLILANKRLALAKLSEVLTFDLVDLIYSYLPKQSDKNEIIFLLPELPDRPSSRGGGMIKSKKKKNKSKKRNKSKKKRKTRKRRRSNKNSKK